jgi:DNA-binding winged helix-turn-helix (wHTH) protein
MRLRFGGFVLDTATRELAADGAPVHLAPKTFDLLELLVERRPAAVPRAEIERRVWGGTHVSETSLASLVGELRKALDDQGKPPRFVRTVHGFGYAFCGEAAVEGAPGPASTHGYRLIVARREIALSPGENILGREAGAVAWLDSASVSRRHARIVVTGAGATVEDLGSRNGTHVNERPVTAPVPLEDGDEVRLGTVRMTFRVVPAGQTETG